MTQMHVVKSPDLEWTYVASIIARPAAYEEARVDPYDLPTGPRDLLIAALAVRDRGDRVSPMSLRLQLEGDGYEAVDAMLAKARVPVEVELAPIARRLRDIAEVGRLAAPAQALVKAIAARDIEAARDACSRLTSTHDPANVDSPVMTFRELLQTTIAALSAEESARSRMISLGMAALDATYRLSPGSLLVVGAQTNVGKTSVIMTWLLDIARRGFPVGLVSVEDPEEDFGAKAIGELVNINPKDMWAGRISTNDWQRMMAIAEQGSRPLSFAYVGSRRIDEVLARIEFMVRVRGARVIAIDYLQSIVPRGSFNSRREAIDSVLADLISTCGRLGVALILASQLARPDKGNPFREPQLIDLKESGEIENRAQCVVMLWRDSDAPGEVVHGKVAKAKRQPAGARFDLGRDPDSGMLVEMHPGGY